MIEAFSSRTLGVAVIFALACSQAWSADKSPGPPIGSFPAWVTNRLLATEQEELRIALIGYCPHTDDPRLRPNGQSRVLLPDWIQAEPSRPDTEMIAWLRSTYPRTLILAAPITLGPKPLQTKTTVDAIEWALKYEPRVIFINYSLLHSRGEAPPDLSQSLTHCWARACLPVTVTQEVGKADPIGILVVSLISEREVGECVNTSVAFRPGPEKLWDQPIALCLSTGLLKEATAGVDLVRAATAYLALGAAMLPARGRTAHLERVSLLTLVTPVYSSQTKGRPYFRLVDLDLSAAPKEGFRIYFLAQPFSWNARAGDVGWIRKEAVKLADEPDRRILVGVWGGSLIRHLSAAAQVAQIHPLYMLGRERGLMACRSLSMVRPAGVEDILRLLDTQVDAVDSHFMFYSLSRDAEIKF